MRKFVQTCTSCNNTFTGRKLPNGYCQACYNYFRLGGQIHSLPQKGTVKRDEEDKVICHICGKSFRVLGDHVRLSHHMSIKEYKEEFGICNNTQLTENNYHTKMQNYALYYNMDQQLIATGLNTRCSSTRKIRLDKPDREQQRIAKRNRKK